MDFKANQPIFVQIAERLNDEILSGLYPVGERIPGVRDYGALLEVNVNTVVKSFDYLAQQGIIFSKRGMGYFVADEARDIILEARRKQFRETTLPDFFKQIRQLHIDIHEIVEAYESLPAED